MKAAVFRQAYVEDMLKFFSFGDEWDPAAGIPSFVKYARRIGVTHEELLRFRDKHPAFRAAYRECAARLRDFLVDGVRARRFDASFVKLLLSDGSLLSDGGDEDGGDAGNAPFRVTVTVLGADGSGDSLRDSSGDVS